MKSSCLELIINVGTGKLLINITHSAYTLSLSKCTVFDQVRLKRNVMFFLGNARHRPETKCLTKSNFLTMF